MRTAVAFGRTWDFRCKAQQNLKQRSWNTQGYNHVPSPSPALCSAFNHLYGYSTLWICTHIGLLQEDSVEKNRRNQLLFPKYSPVISSVVMSQINFSCLKCTNNLFPLHLLIFSNFSMLHSFVSPQHSLLYRNCPKLRLFLALCDWNT